MFDDAGYIEWLIDRIRRAAEIVLRQVLGKQGPAAAETVRQTCQEALGLDYDVLLAFPAEQTASLLGDCVRVAALAHLVSLEAEATPDLARRVSLCAYARGLLDTPEARGSAARALAAETAERLDRIERPTP